MDQDNEIKIKLPSEIKYPVGSTLLIQRSLDNLLSLIEENEFKQLIEKIDRSEGISIVNTEKFYKAGSCEIKLAKENEIIIPKSLYDHLGQTDQEIVFEKMLYGFVMRRGEQGQIFAHVPSDFSYLYDKKVIVMRGPNNSIYLYLPEKFQEIKNQIDSNSKRYNLTYPMFKKHLALGTVERTISNNGIILLPNDFYLYLGSVGTVYFKEDSKWLQIKKAHANECFCDDPNCVKCLRIGCKNIECSMHNHDNF